MGSLTTTRAGAHSRAHHYKWEGHLTEGLLDHSVISWVREEQVAEKAKRIL